MKKRESEEEKENVEGGGGGWAGWAEGDSELEEEPATSRNKGSAVEGGNGVRSNRIAGSKINRENSACNKVADKGTANNEIHVVDCETGGWQSENNQCKENADRDPLNRSCRENSACENTFKLRMVLDLMKAMMEIEKKGKSAALLVMGVILCVLANQVHIVSMGSSSDLLEKLSKGDKNALKTLLMYFLQTTAHSFLREGYVLLFLSFVNTVIFDLSSSLFKNALYSNKDLSSVRINRVVDRGEKSISQMLQKILIGVLNRTISACLVFMKVANISTWYILLLAAFNALYVFISYVLIRQRVRYKIEMNRCDDEYSEKILEAVENIDVVRSSNTEEEEIARFRNKLKKYFRIRTKDALSVLLLNIAQKGIYSVLMLAVLLDVYNNSAEKVKTASYLFYLIKEMDKNVMNIAISSKGIFVLGVDCHEYLSLRRALFNSSPAQAEEHPAMSPDASSALEFRNVGFTYPPSEEALFEGLSFSIRKGEKVCIVGKSGSGKSTLVSLILKRYRYTGGIFLYGKEIREIPKDKITERVGIVTQDSGMFKRTLAENITYGCKDLSSADFNDICTTLSLDAVVESKAERLEYMVDAGGRNLSGGEKQRIALARALLKRPEILIFDESTSKLDPSVEQKIIRHLLTIPATVIVLAHSASVAAMMHRTISI